MNIVYQSIHMSTIVHYVLSKLQKILVLEFSKLEKIRYSENLKTYSLGFLDNTLFSNI